MHICACNIGVRIYRTDQNRFYSCRASPSDLPFEFASLWWAEEKLIGQRDVCSPAGSANHVHCADLCLVCNQAGAWWNMHEHACICMYLFVHVCSNFFQGLYKMTSILIKWAQYQGFMGPGWWGMVRGDVCLAQPFCKEQHWYEPSGFVLPPDCLSQVRLEEMCVWKSQPGEVTGKFGYASACLVWVECGSWMGLAAQVVQWIALAIPGWFFLNFFKPCHDNWMECQLDGWPRGVMRRHLISAKLPQLQLRKMMEWPHAVPLASRTMLQSWALTAYLDVSIVKVCNFLSGKHSLVMPSDTQSLSCSDACLCAFSN